ncbi:hypothetical protein LTR84_003273 [Exophiala bonariae]|uniref:Anaphase-promoting complex subunit 4 WD40 domain-containing protein n=1 Tax=Exophiala bonariae TaxID=1690606 RepID=A0AAV9N8J0_9EURO|nr:hypothetical protein LTR84_003273 [Exophiala bonariae]
MSQSSKRNAEIAFEGNDREDPHNQKKPRTKQPTPTHQTTILSPPKEENNGAESHSSHGRVRSRTGHRRSQETKLIKDLGDAPDNVTPQSDKAQPTKEEELAAENPKHQKRLRRSHKDKEKNLPKPVDETAAWQSSVPSTTPNKQRQSNSVPQKAEEDRSTSGEATQKKFMQVAQEDGLAVFNVPKESDQLALVASQKKKKSQKQKTSETVAEVKRPNAGHNSSRWSISPSKGGIFIDQDPLLTADGKYLLLPTHSQLRVYSTQTSLLIRSLQTSHGSSIVSCALSLIDPTKVYVAYTNDKISLWDWTTSQKLGQTATQNRLRRILPMAFDGKEETVLALRHGEEKSSSVVAYSVDHTGQQCNLATTILERPFSIMNIASYAAGSVLIASSAGKILLGYSQDIPSNGQQLSYTWRELSMSGFITSFDARVRPYKAKGARRVPIVDLVVGFQSGTIMIYQDLLFRLIGKEKSTDKEDITPRKLHWHRSAVNAVRWSRDQQYIISGGNETVLVIWQLNTNEKQFLPHLSTSILNLTISAKGSEYGLRLGDNSVMVLSTADLLPSTNITGPAISEDALSDRPMLLHPTIAGRLIAAVPANVITKNQQRENNATLLQQFDIDSGLQVSRQALTRNVTTVKNVAPTGKAVVEPNVDYIAISYDGKWLATIDRWTPLKADIASMYLDGDSADSRGHSTETTLRIWGWNEDENVWELVTRINEPHRPGDRSVLGLVANQSKAEFATIGSDSTIQIWSPKARHRNGVAVKNKTNEQLYTWSSSRSIDCGHERLRGNEQAKSATIAYSDDGSTIAASWSWLASQTRLLHLIDAASGKISLTLPDILSPREARLAFAGRHLLCLSDTFCVFDLLTAQTILNINLDSEAFGQRHLATNKFEGTVAISISPVEKNKSSKLLLLSITGQDVKPVWETSVPGLILGLLASTTGSGYVLIDGKARISTLRSKDATIQGALSSALQRTEPAQVSKSLDSIFGRGGQPLLTAGDQEGLKADGSNVLSSSNLDAVLNFVSSNHAPSPTELFERIVGAFGRRDAQESVVA